MAALTMCSRKWGMAGILVGLFLMTSSLPSFSEGLPAARRGEAERYLFMAYDLLVRQRYWESLDALERALARNTYLVDYYLLKSLVLRRLGLLAEAEEALLHYLEVRPREEVPQRMLAAFRQERSAVEALLDGTAGQENFQFLRAPLERFFNLSYLTPWNPLGIAKVRSVGAAFVAADELGHALVEFFPGSPPNMVVLSADVPVAVSPLDLRRFLVLNRRGELRQGMLRSPDLIFLGSLDVIPADGACLAGNVLGVADWGGRRTVFFDIPTLRELWSWAPVSRDPLRPFEPVALSALGSLVAVADRGAGRVCLLEERSRQLVGEFPVPLPRDVLWTRWGSLLILSEEGRLFLWREGESPVLVVEGLVDAWSLSESSEGVFVWDVAGKTLWQGTAYPSAAAVPSVMSLVAPAGGSGSEPEAVIRAYIGEPARALFPKGRNSVSAVWMGRKLEGTLVPFALGEDRGVLLLAKGAPPGGMTAAVLQDGAMLLTTLRQTCRESGTLPTCLVVDVGIPFTRQDLIRLLGLALNNDIRVYGWGASVPSPEFVRLMRSTGGGFLPALEMSELPAAPRRSWEVRIPLPVDALPSGYPSEAMLSVYVDAGSLTLRDWLPFWPVGFGGEAQPLLP